MKGERMDPVKIGNRLRELRGIRTQKGVAKCLGISQNALVNYEKGRRIPPTDTVVRMADYYGVSVESILFC